MKKQVRFAAAAALCAVITVSLGGCFTISVELPTSAETAENMEQIYDYVQTPDNIAAPSEQTASNETLPASETAAVTETPSAVTAPVQTEQQNVVTAPAPTESHSSAAPVTAAPETPTAAPAAQTPDALSGQALLTYFNEAINSVKTQKAGFKKSKLTTIKDLQLSNSVANTLVGFVKGALLSETEDVTDVAKGQSSDNVLSPSGKSYASALTMNDIKNINVQKSGSGYVITVNLKDETNPTDSGPFSRCMDYMTVDDVENVYAPKVGATVSRDEISVKLTNSYAKLTVDSNGRVTAYETLVNGELIMKNASIKKGVTIKTDLDITLSSTTKYTGFAF